MPSNAEPIKVRRERAGIGLLDPLDLLKKKDGVEPDYRHRFGASLLNTADTCLRRCGYTRDKVKPFTGSDETVCGTGYHAGLEVYYLNRLETGEVTPTPSLMQEIYDAVELVVRAEVDKIGAGLKWITSTTTNGIVALAQHLVHTYFAQGHYWPDDWTVIGVEQVVAMPAHVEGWVLKSTIDLILRHVTDGLLVLTDHKTARKAWKAGKESPRSTNQPAMYADQWERATGERPDAFFFDVMTIGGVFERRQVVITDEIIEACRMKERTVLPLLDAEIPGGLPGNTSSFLCSEKWCDYWDICPFGAAFTKTKAA